MKTITTSIAALLLLTGCDNAQTSAPQRPLPEVGIVTLMSQPVSVVSELTGRTAAAMSAEVRPQRRRYGQGRAGAVSDRSFQLPRRL